MEVLHGFCLPGVLLNMEICAMANFLSVLKARNRWRSFRRTQMYVSIRNRTNNYFRYVKQRDP